MSEGLVLPDSGTRRTTTAAAALLVLVTAVWGSTFVMIKDVVRTLPVPDFLALRFLIAAAVMVPVFWRPLRRLSRPLVWRGLALGAIYGLAQIFQTFGLSHTSAAVSGFVTGMYVVLTPVLGALLLGQRAPASTWFAVALSTAGLAVLALHGFAVGTGELLVLISAALYALHIVALGLWSGAQDALGLATIQMVAIAVLCTVAALPHGIEATADRRRLGGRALHRHRGRRVRADSADLGAGAPAGHPGRGHHDHGTGVRRAVRRTAGRRAADPADVASAVRW